MNTGAFGEGFPYTNFHNLNMDWIIKIAKDFLDQYTNIQQTIENGMESIENLTEEELTALQTKADELEDLLNQWYATHSQDIANQLASAVAEFTRQAVQKTAETIASIPDDYTTLSDSVKDLQAHNVYNIILNGTGQSDSGTGITFTKTGEIINADGTASTGCNYNFVNSANNLLGMIPNETYKYEFITEDNNIAFQGFYYKEGGSFGSLSMSDGKFTLPNNAVGIWFRARIESGTTVNNKNFTARVYSLEDEKTLDISNNVLQNGLFDFVPEWRRREVTHITGSGITYTPQADESIIVNGTSDSSQTSYYYFIENGNGMQGIKAGNTYSVEYECDDSNIELQLFEVYNSPSFRQIYIRDNKYLDIDEDATALFFRIKIPTSTTVTNARVVFKIYSNINPFDLYEDIEELPLYWRRYLKNKAPSLFTADKNLGFSGFSFAFITDLHWLYNTKKSPAILRWIINHTSINMVVQGGDILSNYTQHGLDPDEAYREYISMTKDMNVINIFGNHDLDTESQTSEIYSKNNYYAICQRITEPFVKWEKGTLCGYYDNEVQKVRMIFWDYSRVYYDQLKTWITELPSGWSVLIFTHLIWQYPNSAQPNPTYGQPLIDAVDSVYDTANCTIIGIVCGHLHGDKSGTSIKGYPIIGTTCDASSGGQPDSDPDNPTRTPGTTTEQAFDLMYIDTTNRTINTIRIGAGDTTADRTFSYPNN